MPAPRRKSKPDPDTLRAELLELAERRAELQRQQDDIARELADVADRARPVLTVTEIAELAGVSRKAVYDALAWRSGERSSRH